MDSSATATALTFYQSRNSILTLSAILMALTLISIILRFLARRQTRASIALDDHFIVASFLFFYGYTSVTIWMGITADNNSSIALTIPLLETTLKASYTVPLLAMPTLAFSKLSLLALYHRIFATTVFRKWVKIMVATCIAWHIACTITAMLKCIPIAAAWNLAFTGRCYDNALFVVIAEVINLFQNIIIVIMPVGLIRRLHLPARQRISLSVVFLMGGFVSIISIIRIIYTWNPKNQELALLYSDTWFLTQLACSVIGASLPTYRAFLPVNGISLAWLLAIGTSLCTTITSFRSWSKDTVGSMARNPLRRRRAAVYTHFNGDYVHGNIELDTIGRR